MAHFFYGLAQSAILVLVSLIQANTQLLCMHALLYKYKPVLIPLCYEASSQVSTLKSITLVFLNKNIFNCQTFFLLIYFLCAPLNELAFYSLIYPLCLFPLYLNHAFTLILSTKFILHTIYLMCSLQVKLCLRTLNKVTVGEQVSRDCGGL